LKTVAQQQVKREIMNRINHIRSQLRRAEAELHRVEHLASDLIRPARGENLSPEDQRLLFSSVSEWNAWYKSVGSRAQLRGVDLRGADLRGADLGRAYLQEAYLQGADLQGADLQGADLYEAYLQGAYLQGADLQGADLQGADLYEADLQGAKYSKRTKFPQGFDPEGEGMVLID
jgi:uncharacterized protein YjbI with pentapeptide repeats